MVLRYLTKKYLYLQHNIKDIRYFIDTIEQNTKLKIKQKNYE